MQDFEQEPLEKRRADMNRAVLGSRFEQELEWFRSNISLGISIRRGTLDVHMQKLFKFSKRLGKEIPKDVLETVGRLKKEARLRRKLDESKFRRQGFSWQEIKSQRGKTPSAMKKRRK